MIPDATAIDQGFQDHEKLAEWFVSTMAIGRDIRDDVLQEARWALWDACSNYDPKKGKLSTLAVRCMRNRVLNYLNKLNREAERVCLLSLHEALSMTSREPEPLEVAHQSELAECIAEQLSRLPRRMRVMVEMYYGLAGVKPETYLSIAKKNGVSKEGARLTVARARVLVSLHLAHLDRAPKTPGV